MPPHAGGCAAFGLEHSKATRACIWVAITLLDYHSLIRQRSTEIIAVLHEKLLPGTIVGAMPRDKHTLVEHSFALAHTPANRCRRYAALAPPPPPPDPASTNGSAHTARTAAGFAASICGPLRAFDVGALPYRWLPGLPVPQMASDRFSRLAQSAERLEVMHVADFWPGPVWLYSAPGSGAWWSPGRNRVVAINLVDAILRFHPMSAVVDHIHSIRDGDRRLARYRTYLQWRVAFGEAPWEAVLAGAAAGNASYEAFASAGELLAVMLTEKPPAGVDSIILTHQMQYWPRGPSWQDSDRSYAMSMVAPCAAEAAAVRSRTHRLPEMIDFRAARDNSRGRHGYAWRSTRDVPRKLYDYISAQGEGSRCEHGRRSGTTCTTCTRASLSRVLCDCLSEWGVLKTISLPTFDAARARECCLAGAARLWARGSELEYS